MDALIEIPKEQWAVLRDTFKREWPQGISGYCLLDTHLSFQLKSLNLQVYCAYGLIENGFVGILKYGDSYEIIIETICPTLKALEEALCTSNVIDWRHPSLVFTYLGDGAAEVVKNVCRRRNFQIVKEIKALKQTFDKNTYGFLDLELPPNTRMGKLKPEHLTLVNSSWCYHDASSHLIFKDLIENGKTYALYSKDEDLMAWMTINEAGALCNLYCLPPYRRKGYAEFIVKYATNDLLRNNKSVILYTDDDNMQSRYLFRKLDFKVLGSVSWLYVRKSLSTE